MGGIHGLGGMGGGAHEGGVWVHLGEGSREVGRGKNEGREEKEGGGEGGVCGWGGGGGGRGWGKGGGGGGERKGGRFGKGGRELV